MKLITDNLMDIRASAGIVKDYAPTPNDVHDLNPDLDVVLDMFRYDPVLSTALDLTVDLATYNGYDFVCKSERQRDMAFNMFDNVLDFDQVIDNVLYSALIFGDAFMEVRMAGNKPSELWPLESTEMKLVYDEHGEITGYQQMPHGTAKDVIDFSVDEVIYFRMKWIGSRVNSYSPFEPASKSYATMMYGNQYLQSIFKNVPPKIMWTLKQASTEQRKLFIQNLLKAKSNPNIDLVALGESDAKMLQVTFDSGLVEVLDRLRQDVMMITRIPPVWLGITDGSNRSSSETMTIPFETRIKKLQSKIASAINKQLMPKLGLGDVTFKFNPISLRDEKLILEAARQLKDMGFDSDTVVDYLKNKGFQLAPESHIMTPEEAGIIPGQSATVGKKDEKGFQSRKRMDGKVDSVTNNLDKSGVSAEGGKKLEKAQLAQRSIELPESAKHWVI